VAGIDVTITEQQAYADLQDEAIKLAIQVDLEKKIIKALSKALKRYVSKQRVMNIKATAKGLCKRCGKKAVTKYWCADCRDKWNDYQKHGVREVSCIE